MDDKVSLDQVEAALEGIQEKYNTEFYPFEVVQSRFELVSITLANRKLDPKDRKSNGAIKSI